MPHNATRVVLLILPLANKNKTIEPANMNKKLRNASKLSQERFAERLGMSRDTIYNYEKGKTAIPHDLIKRLCQEFNVSADYFYFNIDKPLIEPINILDSFDRTLQECTDFEKQQLMDMLNIIRRKPVAV